MKIVKVNTSKVNAYASIIMSMSSQNEIAICNGLDACGCTGNSLC